MLKTFALSTLLLSGISSLIAQPTATVTGKLTDQTGDAITGVNVKVIGFPKIGATSKEDGSYRIEVPAEKELSIVFSFISYQSDTQKVSLKPNEVFNLNVKLAQDTINIKPIEVNDESIRNDASGVMINAQEIEKIPMPFAGVEAALAFQALGVSSTNELSSTYSVRGGNYDENLVYVNDFEVYRPFLIHSGQQEGLSFINPDLANTVYFSSGGFQPKYGDKMSSVLDVQYKRPKEFKGSVELGLLGGSFHLEGCDKKNKFTYLLGVRQKSSQYLLKSQDTKGEYNPSFTDVQSFLTYKVSDKVDLEWLTNFARNKFSFKPVDRETTFGVVNDVLRLTMYFDGSEEDAYRTFMTGFGVNHKINRHLGMKWYTSVYTSVESEAYDILGEYWLDEVESDFSNSNFGNTRYSLGVGGTHDYARNDLESLVSAAGYKGYFIQGSHALRWGANYQHETIHDRLNEWEMIDSAGYSIPYGSENDILFPYVLKSKISLQSNRINGYIQDTWTIDAEKGLSLTYGGRLTWWDTNKEWVASPRIQFSYHPKTKSDVVFHAAAGFYNQPPFYREMRDLDGYVNLNLQAQKSLHFVAGVDLNFMAWDRKFKFVTEVYYKYLYDLVPYEFDNVLIRYFGQNQAHGYAAGIDLRLNGELVEGAESWVSMSVMSTQEDIDGDHYTAYHDSTGTRVYPTYKPGDNSDTTAVEVYPGYIPRPTDQRVRFNLFFQDYLPKLKTFKVHLNLVFATGLPFGPPDKERYNDLLRAPFYRRVDIGFSALLFDRTRREVKPKSFMRFFESIWATFEIYNMLGVNNVVSYEWVKDTHNTVYAVPNYLTNRRFNVRIIFKF